MNKYQELTSKHQKKVNEFPIIFAFSNFQLAKGMSELGVTDTSELVGVGGGGFIAKRDVERYTTLGEDIEKELQQHIIDDEDGTGFVYDMFYYELCNHEYNITYDVQDALNALNYTADDINKDEKLKRALTKAKEDCIENSVW